MPGNTRKVITPSPQAKAPLAQLPPDLLGEVTKRLSNEAMGRLSQTCRLFHASFQETMRTIELQQAVLDGDIPGIQRILNAQPELLLLEPKRKHVIQSQLTRKKVFGEMPFAMALKTRQNKVIKTILPYIAKIDNGQQKALALWDEIDMLPVKAPYHFKSLIDVIVQETFRYGFGGKLSDATEQALKAFKDSVNPEDAIALNDDYDVLGHLVSAAKAFKKHIDQFTNREQRALYAIRVYGFLQFVLQRENGEAHCHGLSFVACGEKPTSDRARNLELIEGEAFFRGNGEAGLGIDFWCGRLGDAVESAHEAGISFAIFVQGDASYTSLQGGADTLTYFLEQTNISSASLKASLVEAAGLSQRATQWCMIV